MNAEEVGSWDGDGRYNDDAVGNVLSISRQSAFAVSVLDFAPKRGPVETQVTVYRTEFSSPRVRTQ